VPIDPASSTSDDAVEYARANRTIAKSAGRRRKRGVVAVRSRPESSSLRLSYRAILPRTSSKRSSSSFRGILAFILRAFLASKTSLRDVPLSRRCAIEREQREEETRRRRGGDEAGLASLRLFECHEPGPLVASRFCG